MIGITSKDKERIAIIKKYILSKQDVWDMKREILDIPFGYLYIDVYPDGYAPYVELKVFFQGENGDIIEMDWDDTFNSKEVCTYYEETKDYLNFYKKLYDDLCNEVEKSNADGKKYSEFKINERMSFVMGVDWWDRDVFMTVYN